MPPRIRLPPPRQFRIRIYNHQLRLLQQQQQCSYASLATATTPAPRIAQTISAAAPIARYPPTQPPSYKPPEFRKSQLLRQYTSLLQSSPLLLLFQHNNLRAVEWAGIRRELVKALRKVDEQLATAAAEHADTKAPAALENAVKVKIVQTGIFRAAVRIVEFYRPEVQAPPASPHPSDPATQSSAQIPDTLPTADDLRLTHALSTRAHDAAADRKKKHELDVLLSGPIACVSFPTVTPQHLKAVLSILAPSPQFPAPRRKVNPDYHEPNVQTGLHKLMLLAARVEGRVFDSEGARWVGGIEGGIDGLRAQLVGMLQSFGAGLTNALEGASRSLYLTMESRKMVLEEEAKPKEENEDAKPEKEEAE